MLEKTIQSLIQNNNVPMKDDMYGHSLYGNIILFLLLSKEECQDLQDRSVGRNGFPFHEFFDVVPLHPVPDFIVLKDEETTYITRFSNFEWKEDSFSLTLYALKPLYFALGEVLQDSLIFMKQSVTGHDCIFLRHVKNRKEN